MPNIYFTSLASQKSVLINYDAENPQAIHNQSALNANLMKDGVPQKVVKSTHLMSLGLKVNIAFEL